MPRATIFEEHASVLAHWWAGGVRNATLVTLDAHLDLQYVDAARIERMRQARTATGLQALESRHPLDPDRSACYGIEDFLLPAARLGLVARVVWVAPPHVLRAGWAMALAGLQQMEGVTPAHLESFERTAGGWLQGELLGVPLAIGSLEQLAGMALVGPVLVDVDADYFVEVPGDTLWTQPEPIARALQAWVGPEADLTIARSVGTGFLPLSLHWIADNLAACWEGRETPPISSGQDNLLRRLGEVRARARTLDLAGLLALDTEVKASSRASSCPAAAWVALGLLHARFGRLDDAIACDAQARPGGRGHPELALEIGRLLLAAARDREARPWFERAGDDDETRVQAWLHLAELALKHGAPGQAWTFARLAHEAAPAWPAPLQRMAAAARAGGADDRAAQVLEEHAALHARLQRLAQRLGA
jgi:hypothetical protein